MSTYFRKNSTNNIIPVKTGISKEGWKLTFGIPTFVGMTSKVVAVLLVTLLASCNNTTDGSSSVKVDHHGVLREIMMENKLEANADLDDYKNIPNLYALGALEGLSGEILILDSQPVNGLASEGTLSIDKSFDKRATLLVSGVVTDWIEIAIPKALDNLKTLESVIMEKAQEAGIDTSQAFPFMLKGRFSQIDWHVINAKDAKEQTHEAYKVAGLSGTENNVNAEVLGFYSEKHQGVFTHHGSFLHLHFVNDAETIMGHVDEIKMESGITLLLPKTY